MMDLMKMLSDPSALTSIGEQTSSLTTTLQEIRNSVILQNCLLVLLLETAGRTETVETSVERILTDAIPTLLGLVGETR